MEYLADTMRDFNRSIAEFIRRDLGSKVLLNAGNWRTANEDLLLDAERWSYTANEVIGVNRYVTGIHLNPTEGRKAGYLLSKGDLFTDESVLLSPRRLSINLKQVAGRPIIVSEGAWVPPMSHQSEGPFLVAAYSALTGVDIYYWFSLGSTGYDSTIAKWQAASPAVMGGWPAAALLFRRGLVKMGAPVVHEERALADIWTMKSTLLSEDESFDPNRDEGSFPRESPVRRGVDPLSFLVGPVEVKYGGDPARTTVADLRPFIDSERKTVTSVTGELRWDHGLGLVTLDAPRAQGATGFLDRAGVIKLGTVTISSRNPYATVLVVAMDDRDLAESKEVLVQTTTVSRPYGWRESDASFETSKKTFQGKRIDDLGRAPWNVVKTEVAITVRNPRLRKATLLDPNGLAVEELHGESTDGAYRLQLPENALYVILE